MPIRPEHTSRREFLSTAVVASALTASGLSTPVEGAASASRPEPKIRMGVVGGGFGTNFFWHEHPNCVVQAVSDLRPERRDALAKVYLCQRTYESIEKLVLDKDVEAVAIFTGAPDHVRHAVLAMNAGKHVISAVPAATTLEDGERLLETKKRTGLKYMMAETSYYRAHTIAARDLFRQNSFGEIFYSEVEYYHPRTRGSIQQQWFYNGQRTWRYGMPPMLYPTHSTAFLVGVTGERLTSASCLGWGNPEYDIYAKRDNAYNNPFNAESALFHTSKGHICRCNVFWINGPEHGERAQWFGTQMNYYMPHANGQPFRITGRDAPTWKEVPNFWERLPEPLRHDSGHGGSHTFITHEFVSALLEDREPTVNVYEALAMTAPGIVAHQSALKGGERLPVPSFDPKTS